MARRANPTLIGAFVLAAIALAVGLVVFLGSWSFRAQTRHFVVVFKTSLHGLSTGAPVTIRGVPVGKVTDIVPVVTVVKGQPTSVHMLVTIELDRSRFRFRSAQGTRAMSPKLTDRDLAKVFDQEGVRAQLATQSLLTGQLYVDLDFFPGSPLNVADIYTPYPQIGTIQTGLAKLGTTVETLPLDQLAAKAVGLLDGLDRTINSPAIAKILSSVEKTSADTEKISAKLDASLQPVLGQLRAVLQATTTAMSQASATLALDTGVPGEVASSFIATLDQARETIGLKRGPAADLVVRLNRVADSSEQALTEAKDVLTEAKHLLDERSASRQNLDQMLTELAQAARSIRSLANYLDRHPEALVQGRRP
jgi:phospholipid/cholesterol/gamma-HCH transport system substrate-binding protein